MTRADDREREALERREGDVTVPLLSGTNEQDGWKWGGPLGWLVDWVARKVR